MRKYIGYIPAALFTGFYLFLGIIGASLTISMILVWLACFWISAFFLHKGLFWGGIFGFIPAINMIYMGGEYRGQVINIEIPLGIILLLFYTILGIYLWKKRHDSDASKVETKEIVILAVKFLLTIVVLMVSAYVAVLSALILTSEGIHSVISGIGMFVIPSLFLPLIWLKKRKYPRSSPPLTATGKRRWRPRSRRSKRTTARARSCAWATISP